MFERFSLKRRIGELEEAFDKLQRDHKALQLEWTNTLDKLNQIAGRMNKRAALAQEKEDALMGKQEKLPFAPESAADEPLSLTPRQRLIQQQILERRASAKRLNGGE